MLYVRRFITTLQTNMGSRRHVLFSDMNHKQYLIVALTVGIGTTQFSLIAIFHISNNKPDMLLVDVYIIILLAISAVLLATGIALYGFPRCLGTLAQSG